MLVHCFSHLKPLFFCSSLDRLPCGLAAQHSCTSLLAWFSCYQIHELTFFGLFPSLILVPIILTYCVYHVSSLSSARVSVPEDRMAEGKGMAHWQPQPLLCCLQQFHSGPGLAESTQQTEALQLTLPSQKLVQGRSVVGASPLEFTLCPTQLTTGVPQTAQECSAKECSILLLSSDFCSHHIKGS